MRQIGQDVDSLLFFQQRKPSHTGKALGAGQLASPARHQVKLQHRQGWGLELSSLCDSLGWFSAAPHPQRSAEREQEGFCRPPSLRTAPVRPTVLPVSTAPTAGLTPDHHLRVRSAAHGVYPGTWLINSEQGIFLLRAFPSSQRFRYERRVQGTSLHQLLGPLKSTHYTDVNISTDSAPCHTPVQVSWGAVSYTSF